MDTGQLFRDRIIKRVTDTLMVLSNVNDTIQNLNSIKEGD